MNRSELNQGEQSLRKEVPHLIHFGPSALIAGGAEMTWSNSELHNVSAKDLRLACTCAACKDEWTGKPLLNPDSIPTSIQVTGAQPIGRYALQIQFSDGHQTGIYDYEQLYSLGSCSR